MSNLYVGAQPVQVLINGSDFTPYLINGSISDSYASKGGLAPTTASLTFKGPGSILDDWANSDLRRGNTVLISINGNLHTRGTLKILSAAYEDEKNTLTVEAGCIIALYQGKAPADVRDAAVQTFGPGRTIRVCIEEALQLGEVLTQPVIWDAPAFSDFTIRGPLNPSGGWLGLAGSLLESINCYAYCRSDGRVVVREINISAVAVGRILTTSSHILHSSRLNGEPAPDAVRVTGDWRKIIDNGFYRTFDQGSVSGWESLDPGANPEYEKETDYWFASGQVKIQKAGTLREEKRYSAGDDGKLLIEYKTNVPVEGVIETEAGGAYAERTKYEYTGDFLTSKTREKINTITVIGDFFYTYDQLQERDVEEWTKQGSHWTYKKVTSKLFPSVSTLVVTNPDGSSTTTTNTSWYWDVDTETASGTAAQPPTAERKTPGSVAESVSVDEYITGASGTPGNVGVKTFSIPHLPDSAAGYNYSNQLTATGVEAVAISYARAFGIRNARILEATRRGIQLVTVYDGEDWLPLTGIHYTRRSGEAYILMGDGTSWQFDRTRCLMSYDGLNLGGAGTAPVVIDDVVTPEVSVVPGGSFTSRVMVGGGITPVYQLIARAEQGGHFAAVDSDGYLITAGEVINASAPVRTLLYDTNGLVLFTSDGYCLEA